MKKCKTDNFRSSQIILNNVWTQNGADQRERMLSQIKRKVVNPLKEQALLFTGILQPPAYSLPTPGAHPKGTAKHYKTRHLGQASPVTGTAPAGNCPHDSVPHDFVLHSPGIPDFCTVSAPFLHHEMQFQKLYLPNSGKAGQESQYVVNKHVASNLDFDESFLVKKR